MFAEISNKQQWVAAPHLPFPGIGHVYKVNAEQYHGFLYILITVLISKNRALNALFLLSL